MNSLYEYFFPPTPAPVAAEPVPEPEPVPEAPAAPAKIPSLCFMHKNELYTVSLTDVASMSAEEIRLWRRMIIAHSLETFDMEESENAAILLAELAKTLLVREAHFPKNLTT